jgi:hypothetical protein
MEWLVILAIGLVGLVLAFWLFIGALAVLPVTVGLAIVGWLIWGPTGAMAGAVIASVIGCALIHNA